MYSNEGAASHYPVTLARILFPSASVLDQGCRLKAYRFSSLVGIAAALWLAREPLGEMAYGRAVKAVYGRDATADLGDGLYVILRGVAAAYPGKVVMGEASMLISLPARSGATEQAGLR